MPPAARVTDPFECPLQTPTPAGPIPHVGGPITGPGCPEVLIGGLPAARVTDLGMCTSPAGPLTLPNAITVGSSTVMIGGLPAAYLGSEMEHPGSLVTGGCPTVEVGP
jgi:uncharacterized Zn-binding protein involved in type VI secretion